jgi:hypothetical protein
MENTHLISGKRCTNIYNRELACSSMEEAGKLTFNGGENSSRYYDEKSRQVLFIYRLMGDEGEVIR